jgi:DNA-directed RNA polymerase specialized sigma54-like protein
MNIQRAVFITELNESDRELFQEIIDAIDGAGFASEAEIEFLEEEKFISADTAQRALAWLKANSIDFVYTC